MSSSPVAASQTHLRGQAWRRVTGTSRLAHTAWIALTLITVAVVAVPDFLPWYDYQEWLLQGRIVNALLTDAFASGVSPLYELLPIPVPNLAAPVGIGLLNLVLPIDAAGRAFLVLGCLGFAYSYAFLVRRLHGRPTMVEFTGLVWVFGYFLYRGYLSYLFALPLVFLGIALLHPVLKAELSRTTVAVLTLLDVLTFLSHLVAWGVLLLVLLCYATALWRRGRTTAAVTLIATAAPSLALLAWYTIAVPGARHVSTYTSLRDKALALAEPLQFFLRLDPDAGGVPVFPAQVAVTAGLIAMIVAGVGRRALSDLRSPPAAAGVVLIVLALVTPISNVNDLTKPDQRLLFPGIVLLLASLPWKPAGPRRRAAAVAGVVGVLGLHLIELQSVQPPLRQLFDAATRTIPAGADVTTVAVPANGGCGAGTGPSIGVPALKWFDVERLLRAGPLRANLQETSAVRLRFDPRDEPGLTALTSSAADVADAITAATTSPPDYVEVFACPADLVTIGAELGGSYHPVAADTGFMILQRGNRTG